MSEARGGVLKTCTIMPLPEKHHSDAAAMAIEEREGNTPPARLRSFVEPGRLVSFTGKRLRTGRTVGVYFMDGPEWARDRAFQYIARWGDVANLDYVRTNDRSAALIRTSFQRGGSWSYLGTDAQSVPKDEPTMQLGWLLDVPNDLDEWRRVCVHEGGHGIAFDHEHQHPRRTFQWREEAVYDYYARTQGWSRQDTYRQVIRTLSETLTNFSAYDRDSIMEYPIPRELVVDPADAVGWNDSRSATDKRYAALWYPKPALQETIDRHIDFLEHAASTKREG